MTTIKEALEAWSTAYPESDPDNSIESLWGRYGSEFASAMKATRSALADIEGAGKCPTCGSPPYPLSSPHKPER